MNFRDILMMSAVQGGGNRTLVAGPDLITNGSFTTTSNWTLSQQSTNLPTISGGKLNFVNQDNAGTAKADQTLAGGSSPAGSYQYSIDTVCTRSPGAGTSQIIRLIGAGAQFRGSSAFLNGADGTQTGTIIANGEVSSVRIEDDGSDSTADNFTLKLLS